ncbi:class I SAM-dependent methyltransferase [Limoniibacter endophyticus]|uniref:ATP synthase subunit beta n=1 Tax=Limoniibacter endophyticus TaxID=1565040 RepID=A0A8J3GGI8_9HYPH|nr:class I SAM-dependent methyltransferase [Limoniibacter endophyticus]GHC65689.1 ATP synthase subunit beta [Limoniibacter endophyticus]
MNALERRIREMIVETGPMSVATYMSLCLFDPRDGYYTTRQPFGTNGDFTTAPEVSQMFGELAGVWLASAWSAPATFAEIGPGRGTLMKDMLRTLARLRSPLLDRDIAMIETSPRLREVQRRTLGTAAEAIRWIEDVTKLPAQPLVIIGNELFDAVPIRQYVLHQSRWHERLVTITDETLAFAIGPNTLDNISKAGANEGDILEVAPARTALMAKIAIHLKTHGGVALFFDYGHRTSGIGDTLQAVHRHQFFPVLERPGEADLTSHVDFEALETVCRQAGLRAKTITQADFLLGMGLLERAGQLGANASEERREALRSEVERLAGPDQMGTLFKVMAVSAPGRNLPVFDAG